MCSTPHNWSRVELGCEPRPAVKNLCLSHGIFFFSINFCNMVGCIHRGPREVHESHEKLPLQVRNHHRRISSQMIKFLNFPIETWDPQGSRGALILYCPKFLHLSLSFDGQCLPCVGQPVGREAPGTRVV